MKQLKILLIIVFLYNPLATSGEDNEDFNYITERENETNEFCEQPIVPDFRKPGRRISEAKCREYFWHDRFLNELKAKRDDECESRKQGPQPADVNGGVAGGTKAIEKQFRHLVAIGWERLKKRDKYFFGCGGSLISSKFVLTAGHCLGITQLTKETHQLKDNEPKIVRLGTIRLNTEPFEDVDILKVIAHPNYSILKDVGLLELKREVEFTFKILPACLWYKDVITDLGNKAIVSGWGVTHTESQMVAEHLLWANVDFLDSLRCYSLLEDRLPSRFYVNKTIAPEQMCAKGEGSDTCKGDSGTPLQVKVPLPNNYSLYYVVGVTSTGQGCGVKNKDNEYIPGLYARVYSFLDWIESVVWPEDFIAYKKSLKVK